VAKTTKRFAGFARGADDAVVPLPRPVTSQPGRQLHHAGTTQETKQTTWPGRKSPSGRGRGAT